MAFFKKEGNVLQAILALGIILATPILFLLYGMRGMVPVILALVSAGIFVYLAWFYKNGPKHIFDKIYISLYVAIYISNLFLQRKTVILLYLIYFLIAAGIELYKLATNKEHVHFAILINIILLFLLSVETDRCVYVNGKSFIYTVSVIIAAVIVVGIMTLFSSKKLEITNPTFSNKAKLILILSVITLMVTSTTIKILNYSLDNSTPETYSAQVISKYLKSHRRSERSCRLLLKINDKTYEFKVKRSEYNQTETNQNVNVYRYEGALSQPYFIK